MKRSHFTHSFVLFRLEKVGFVESQGDFEKSNKFQAKARW